MLFGCFCFTINLKQILIAVYTKESEAKKINNFLGIHFTNAHDLWTFTWIVRVELPFRLKGTDKIHTEGLFKFHSNIFYSLWFEVIQKFTKIMNTISRFTIRLHNSQFIQNFHNFWIFRLHILGVPLWLGDNSL